MFRRVIIIIVGAGFAGDCIATAVLTVLGMNPATLHLTKFFMIGYAAISAVLTPFGISGVIGAVSRKKTLIRAFVTFQWWLATFVLIGLNVFNVVLSKRGKGDFINRCQADLAKSQPNSDSDFLDRCTAKADDAENATFIATCAQGGIMLFVGIIILIVGTREYNHISLEEETKNLLAKASFNEDVETSELRNLSPQTSNFNNNASESRNVGGDDLVRRVTNVKRQPTRAATINVDLERHQTNTNMNSAQNSGLRRNLTDPTGRNQTDINITTPLYRNPTLPGNIPPKRVGRYPPNANDIPVNVTRQPTVGNAYAPRNYADAQATYPPPQLSPTKQYMNPPQRSLSTKQYMNPPQGPLSPTNQYTNPPPQHYLSTKQYINQPLPPLPPPQMKLPPLPPPDVNNNYRPPKPYKQQTMPPYYMGTNQ